MATVQAVKSSNFYDCDDDSLRKSCSDFYSAALKLKRVCTRQHERLDFDETVYNLSPVCVCLRFLWNLKIFDEYGLNLAEISCVFQIMEGFLSPRRSSSSSSNSPRPLKVAGSEAVAAAVSVVPDDGSVVGAGAECALRGSVVAAGAKCANRSVVAAGAECTPRSVAGADCDPCGSVVAAGAECAPFGSCGRLGVRPLRFCGCRWCGLRPPSSCCIRRGVRPWQFGGCGWRGARHPFCGSVRRGARPSWFCIGVCTRGAPLVFLGLWRARSALCMVLVLQQTRGVFPAFPVAC